MGKKNPDEKLLPFNLSNSSLGVRFKNIGIRQGWWFSEKPLVLAVSGGSDSVAMLWFFRQFWHGNMVVAHLEHGIRGQASNDDADYVRSLCSLWQLPLELEHVSVPRLKGRGESTEQAARRVRYTFLYEIRQKYCASAIAIAHNADDVAETVLHNLIRGTGPFGLVGIPESREGVIRPIIDFYRSELRDILESRGISWCEDATNADTMMTRNRIRHMLLPWIEENINHQAKKHIVDLADNMSFFRKLENDRSSSIMYFLERKVPGSIYSFDLIKARSMNKDDIAGFIRVVGRNLGLNSLPRKRLDNLISLIFESGRWRFQWQESIELCAGQGVVGLVNTEVLKPNTAPYVELSCKDLKLGEIHWNGWQIKWVVLDSVCPTGYFSGSRQAVIPFQEGNYLRICCSGSFRQTKILNDIPWWIGNIWPVFLIGSTIFWFPALGENCEISGLPFESGRGIKIICSHVDVAGGVR